MNSPMQKRKTFLLLLFIFSTGYIYSQQDPVIIEYINKYKEIAISEMQRTGVPAAIKLAQGIHETEAGTSKLVAKSNNHFGIKCKSDWTGMTVSHTDDAPNECFRKYNAAEDSYRDHSNFLRKSDRYSSLFKLDPTNYEGWAYGLKKAGYATNPKYPQIIIKLIEDYHLEDYSLIAIGKMRPEDEFLANQVDTGITSVAIDSKPVHVVQEELVVSVKKAEPERNNEPQNDVVKTVIKPVSSPEYPTGEFKINETRVIFASKGTPYLTLAEKYGLSLARIFEFNDMQEQEVLDNDQLIYLMRKRKTGNNDQHIVKEGETLNSIAQTEALRIESLREYNYLKPGINPVVGSVLYLKEKAPAMPVQASGK